MDGERMSSAAWVTVLLGAVNALQVVGLAWIGCEQKRSADERRRRIIAEGETDIG